MQKTQSRWAIGLGVVAVALSAGVAIYALSSPQTNEASPANAQTVSPPSVETIQPRRANVARRIESNGTLEAFETADLYPKLSGYLSEVRVDIGDRVRRGQVLAVISVPELEKELTEAEAVVVAKRADLTLQQVTLERQGKLLERFGTSQQAYDEAKGKSGVAAAEVELAAATVDKIDTMLAYRNIVSPFDGVVTHRAVNRGDFVQSASAGRTSQLFTVQRVDVIRVFCNVPESEVANVKVGLPASVRPYGLNGRAFEGKVTRFAGRLDPETRNMRTEIDLPNPDGALYPGMYAQVSLETELHPDVLTLPSTAVMNDAAGRLVYVVDQGRIQRQPVTVGLAEGNIIEISGGLAEGARVVAVAQGAPPPGTSVNEVQR